jgi:hypothetical protein
LEWYPILIESGLAPVLGFLSEVKMIPVSDYLHHGKNYLNKIKKHPVTMSPDSFDAVLDAENLESVLQLGPALLDKSSVGRMRDSYALQLFSYANCLKCLESDYMNEVMYLIPWAIQEEVVRNPALSRDERLMKAILSFKLLLHYFDLSCLPGQDGISQRDAAGQTEVVTFAPDALWPRILNCALVLIQFVFAAEEHCSFSRVGIHCPETFFGLIRRNSFGGDRLVRARYCAIIRRKL